MNNFLPFAIAVLLLFSTFITFAQPPDGDSTTVKVSFNKHYFKSYVTDTRDIIVAPFHWNTNQAIAATSVVIASAAISFGDLKIKDFFQRSKTPFTNNLSTYGFERWGSGFYSMSAMLLFYTGGTIFKDDRCKKVALLGVKTYLLTGGAVFFPRFIIQRYRPQQSPDNQFNFAGPTTPFTYNSSPSGHTTSGFAIATIIASEYKEKPLLVILSYTVATLSGLSRLNDNKHWASDVFIGAATGYAMAKLIYNKNNWGVKQFKAL